MGMFDAYIGADPTSTIDYNAVNYAPVDAGSYPNYSPVSVDTSLSGMAPNLTGGYSAAGGFTPTIGADASSYLPSTAGNSYPPLMDASAATSATPYPNWGATVGESNAGQGGGGYGGGPLDFFHKMLGGATGKGGASPLTGMILASALAKALGIGRPKQANPVQAAQQAAQAARAMQGAYWNGGQMTQGGQAAMDHYMAQAPRYEDTHNTPVVVPTPHYAEGGSVDPAQYQASILNFIKYKLANDHFPWEHTDPRQLLGSGGAGQAGDAIRSYRAAQQQQLGDEQPLTQHFAVGGSPLVAAGHLVRGPGDGQSDDIDAKLADGEYVFDADAVSALGNGSNEAGAKKLDEMRQNLRAHKRAAPANKIPPPAKSPADYMNGGK